MRKSLWVISQVLLVIFFLAIGGFSLFVLIIVIDGLIDNWNWLAFVSLIVFIIPGSLFGLLVGFYKLPEYIREIKQEYKWKKWED